MPDTNDRANQRLITFAEAIREGQEYCLASDPNVYIMGLGVPDPKGVFGTTLGLADDHGAERVLDMPLSENAMTGVAIGASLVGMRPILVHQRIDFTLISLEQILNQAAKWHYMFGGRASVPMVIRMVVGRGWGQGPQHSQSLHALFAHFPGLKVVMPTTARDAKGMLIASVEDDNPVIFIEHRWLHNIKDHVPAENYRVPIGKGRIMREGRDVTIVAASYMVIDALRAADELAKEGISAEVLDLRTIRPMDTDLILSSVRKSGRVVVADTSWRSFGISAEVIAVVTEEAFTDLKAAPRRVAMPDHPVPTSWSLARHHYPGPGHIVAAVYDSLGRDYCRTSLLALPEGDKLDAPDRSFMGPF